MEIKVAEILIPTDFSERSAAAVRYAATMARRFKSRITLLHVLPPFNIAYPSQNTPDILTESVSAHKAESGQRLGLYLARELKEFAVERVLLEGDPAQQIIDYAASNRTDMIIMETRGTGIFRRYILGSVTAKVLHDAPCPVFTGIHVIEVDKKQEYSIQRIVCAIDPANQDVTAIQWAKFLADAFHAQFSVVHVIPAPPFHLQTYTIESELRMLLSKGERERIQRLLEVAGCPPGTETHVLWGPISKVVHAHAEDTGADLIVIGHGSENGVPGKLHSTGYSIIRDSFCPVLSV